MTTGVYAITNIRNGHRYVGSAVNVANRWGHHRPLLRQGRHHSSHLQRAWNKYGESAFRFTLLEECEPEEVIVAEQSWMDAFPPEYNMAPIAGSCLGRQHTEAARQKMSAASAAYGKTSEAHEQKVRAGRIGGPIGIRKVNETWGKTPEAHEHRLRWGAIGARNQPHEAKALGGRRANETWGQTIEAREHRARAGRMGSHENKVRAAHQRWHVNRGTSNPDCPFCKAAEP